MEAFSDGVFAIAITLLVLEIGVPSGSASALVSLLWRYAVRERLIRTDIADTDVKMITKRLAPGLAGYVAMIALGLFLPVVAVLGYLVIAVHIIVPIGALRRRSAAP
jgi:Endosomal/lysosomal potassium channel TMEM175